MALRLGLSEEGLDLDEVPEHLQSIGSVFWHQVSAVRGDDNNPRELAEDGLMRGGVRSPKKMRS